jgi:hypothetical protein
MSQLLPLRRFPSNRAVHVAEVMAKAVPVGGDDRAEGAKFAVFALISRLQSITKTYEPWGVSSPRAAK